MMIRTISVACGIAMGFAMNVAVADSASVATLTQVTGKVMVNKGKGFTMAKAGLGLADSDRLITLDDSSASVVFADGCVNSVKANSVLAISKSAGCQAQAALVNTPAPTASVMRYAQTPPATNDGGGNTGPSYTPLYIGGAITALCIGNVICDDNKKSGD